MWPVIHIRGCSQTTLASFWLFLTTNPPPLTLSTYPPPLVTVVCEWPLSTNFLRGLGVSVFVNFFDLLFRYQFGHGAKYLEDSIPQWEECGYVLWVTQITYFTVVVLVYFCLRNMKAEFVLKQFWAKTQVFCSGQNYFQLDKTKVLDKFR